MMENPKHICFVDDDQDEIATFERLYDGSVFTVTSVLAQNSANALSQINRTFKDASPDLFVLDLYFPSSGDSSTGFDQLTSSEFTIVTQGLDRITESLETLKEIVETTPDKDKLLLRQAHAVVQRSRNLLDDWCKQLNQSPQGGFQIIRGLNLAFPKILKVFYSRKATLRDAKEALAEGAFDVLSKPDSSLENTQAADLAKKFLDYCNHRTPGFIAKYIDKISLELILGPKWAQIVVSAEKSIK